LVAHHNRLWLEPNKDVIRVIQNLYEPRIPMAHFTHVSRENSFHSIAIMRLNAGPAAKPDMLHNTIRPIEVDNA
jgi:hypothetical protein